MPRQEHAADERVAVERARREHARVVALVVVDEPCARAVELVRRVAPGEVLAQVGAVAGDVARELRRVVGRQRPQPQRPRARGERAVDHPLLVHACSGSSATTHARVGPAITLR